MTDTRGAFGTAGLGSPMSALFASRFVRFLCVGGLNTLFGYGIFLLALRLGAGVTAALVSATALGTLFNFQTSRGLVFGAGQRGRLTAFVAIQGAVLAMNALALQGLVHHGVPAWLAQALLILPMAVVGYVAQANFVFADAPPASPLTARLRASNHLVFATGTALFLLPNALFAMQVHWIPATLVLAGVLGTQALVMMRPAGAPMALLSQPIDRRRLGICAVVALLLLLLGGEGHIFFANWDWLWRDAVLADLARSPFPPIYVVDGGQFMLRAPLGMYVLPALVVKAAGLGLGHVVLLVQNAALLTCVLYVLALLAGQQAILTAAIFLSFSGLDILGQILRSVADGTPNAAFYPPAHIEHWTIFQYSSTITQLFWVPNHALPSYWVALVALFCAVGELTIVELGLALAAVLFWSPFAIIGGLPIAVFIFLRSMHASICSVRFWLASAAALCFLPIAVFMQSGATQVPHGLMQFGSYVAVSLAIFLALKIPHVLFVRATWGELDRRLKGLALVSIAILVCLPTIRAGASNDLVMRASIPSLMILAFVFAQGLDAAWPQRRGFCLLAFVLVAIGCLTPAMEVVRAVTTPRFAISDCGLVTVWKKLQPEADLSNYLARAEVMPGWIGRSAPVPADGVRACWPDLPPFETLNPDAKVEAMSRAKT